MRLTAAAPLAPFASKMKASRAAADEGSGIFLAFYSGNFLT